MTPEDFRRLWELQVTDCGIADRMATIASVDDGSAAAEQLAADEAALAELEEELRQKQAHQRKLELDMKGVEDERKEKSDRAYGGMVSDPKELASLEKKLNELERNVHRHEDMILELLDEMEDLEARTDAQREKAETQRAEHARIVESFDQTTAKAREEIAELEAVREELVPQLPAQLLRAYEEGRRREQGIAVSIVRGGCCSECHLAIPRARMPMVQRGSEIVKCENCRRILVVVKE